MDTLARRRLGCRCNCHSPACRAVMDLVEHATCADCIRELRFDRRWLRSKLRDVRPLEIVLRLEQENEILRRATAYFAKDAAPK